MITWIDTLTDRLWANKPDAEFRDLFTPVTVTA
ncbi:hypothetical protein ACWT_5690 [Actinoplanes sp. SE50]|nr:hypothetical protein ACPL_5820 [Actinoplanes sp. SE50/110]ATO85105.1 hypothetical protein ACWT_5690 [Actinoplanes sp. SE50]SLM02516.1 hypothetical protein ACSP50_5766 [Actinoplanes sp. SE50/110]